MQFIDRFGSGTLNEFLTPFNPFSRNPVTRNSRASTLTVTLTNAKFPKHPDAKKYLAGVVVGEDAKLGASVTVLPGVTIGAGALVGAGSLVAQDVPAGMVAKGAPAKAFRPVGY